MNRGERVKMSGIALKVNQVHAGYGAREVLRNFELELNKGEIGCLLGPSGCGKSTALRCIGGFERIRAGEIIVNGKKVAGNGFHLPPEKRRIGIMFQDLALFPHLNVARNVCFGLHELSAKEQLARVKRFLEIIHLSDCSERFPNELSGGQQQRVALARALAPEPELILLDEPFSNLDADLRDRLKKEVRRIIKDCQATALLVTHDQYEAFDVADRIMVMNSGRVEQTGKAYLIYHKPETRFVADFVGQGGFLPGLVTSVEPGEVQTELGLLSGTLPEELIKGTEVQVFLRPDDLIHDDESPMSAEVIDRIFRGLYHLYTVQLESGRSLQCFAPSHHDHAIGSKIGLRLEVNHLIVFPC